MIRLADRSRYGDLDRVPLGACARRQGYPTWTVTTASTALAVTADRAGRAAPEPLPSSPRSPSP
ncbi:hypothetical protein NS184_13560 [Curtobacterium luteum]|uniref:Uncharacterized protein n=1 Tax=Curtobacterium luteum TaxID=33881 RepID=A0A175RLF0_9MICO|nr:hypothetical protein NS184_13560 [Curtobacterium luteum]